MLNKNKFKLSAIGIIVLATFFSCVKTEKKDECLSCNQKSYSINEIKINESKFQFREYQSENHSYKFLSENVLEYKTFIKLAENFDLPLDVNHKVISVVLFTESSNLIDKNIEINEVKNILVYYKIGEDIYTELFSKVDSKFINQTEYSLKSSFVSSNDIHNLSNFLYPNVKEMSSVVFIDFKNLPITKKSLSEFQNKISSLRLEALSIPDVGKGGGGPIDPPNDDDAQYCDFTTCGSNSEGYCTAQESQSGGESWFCVPLERCVKKKSDNLYQGSNYNEYDLTSQNFQLRSFRDKFLNNSKQGKLYIGYYYYLSEKVCDKVNLSYSINAISVLASDILPIINKLQLEPSSEEILYNSTTANKIIDILNQTRVFLTVDEDKAMIDEIIKDVNFYKNKSTKIVFQEFNR